MIQRPQLYRDMVKHYDGAESGVGATYHRVGKKSGEGKMTLTESVPDSRIVIDLSFIKPFPTNHTTVFTLEPEGDGTRVNMGKLLGKDFESGLTAIATAVARGGVRAPRPLEFPLPSIGALGHHFRIGGTGSSPTPH